MTIGSEIALGHGLTFTWRHTPGPGQVWLSWDNNAWQEAPNEIEIPVKSIPTLIAGLIRAHAARFPGRGAEMDLATRGAIVAAGYDGPGDQQPPSDAALAWNAPVAISCAELEAGNALAAHRGVAMPADDDIGLPNEEQEAVHHEAQIAVHAAIKALGLDPSLHGVTVARLAAELDL